MNSTKLEMLVEMNLLYFIWNELTWCNSEKVYGNFMKALHDSEATVHMPHFYYEKKNSCYCW